MTTLIAAPYPTPRVTLILPSAQLGDTTATEQTTTVQRTMTGDTFTHVKTNDRRKMNIVLRMTRMKSLELQEFMRLYYRAEWRVTLYDDTVWAAKLLNFPVKFRTVERAGGLPGGEFVEVTLELSARSIT